MLTIYPSYIPSDKSLGSLRSPSNEIVCKLNNKSKEISRDRIEKERSKERTRIHS
jgi:hypothetical protein